MKKILILFAALMLMNGGAAAQNDGHVMFSEDLEARAGQFDSDAMYELGLCYLNGYGTGVNFCKGIVMLANAANCENEKAEKHGIDLLKGFATMDEVRKDSIMRCAENGDADAMYVTSAICMSRGEKENFFVWLNKAAGNGCVPAMYSLAKFYFNNDPGDKRGFDWAKKAADAGCYPAGKFLAYYYNKGEVVEKNNDEAMRYARMGKGCCKGDE